MNATLIILTITSMMLGFLMGVKFERVRIVTKILFKENNVPEKHKK